MSAQSNSRLGRGIHLKIQSTIKDHVDTLNEATRMALTDTLEQNQDIRDEVLTLQRAAFTEQQQLLEQTVASQVQLMEALSELIATLNDRLAQPINVPKATITLKQQPVNVMLDKVDLQPIINIPEPKVVVQTESDNRPKRAKITHSDGSQTTIEFTK